MTFPEQAAYPESSQSTMILVLGILGLLCCGPLGIVAWIMGNNEIKAIDEGRRDPSSRGTANAGRIIGIVATVLWAIFIVLGVAGTLTIPFIDS
ncbi:MAG: DUF4190 domain-containing protein [Acidimicrobiia bacterium]